jgi:factor associated with neutral sphingomyelinase activation
MALNSAAGRSRCDLTAYPVFPWVLADYTSATLDLSAPGTFRDLSKPMGALNPKRLASLRERYRDMPRGGEGDDPPFLYGTHYSTPGYCLYFLARSMPEHILRLQSGRFDAPDRMFHDMAATYGGCTGLNSDFKELIPEFYDTAAHGAFTLMPDGLNLGVRAGGKRLGDVGLPPWAYDASDFVGRMREALECEAVSGALHAWIDLVFGAKQRGESALGADNLFYYLTY